MFKAKQKQKVKEEDSPSPNQYYYKPYYHGHRVAGYTIFKKSLIQDSIIAEVVGGERYAIAFVEALNGYPQKYAAAKTFRTCLSCGKMIEDEPQALEQHLKNCKGELRNG